VPPILVLAVVTQYCNGAYISKGGTKKKKKTTQTFVILADNCQTQDEIELYLGIDL
jgi:hypothetical protein